MFDQEKVVKRIRLDYILSGWTFNYAEHKQEVMSKFIFLMSNMVKMDKAEDLHSLISKSFLNQTKKYYNLTLDHLLSKQEGKNLGEEVKKKEIFKYLDCEEILPAFLLMYLVFRGQFSFLEKLFTIYKDLIESQKADTVAALPV